MKIKNIFILSFLLLIANICIAVDVETSGIIFFDDGINLKFNKFVNFNKENFINVRYQNTVRKLNFDNIVEFEILQFELGSYFLKNVTVRIKTTTGVEFETSFLRLDSIRVMILDELSGEKKNQFVSFYDMVKKKINIRKITLN